MMQFDYHAKLYYQVLLNFLEDIEAIINPLILLLTYVLNSLLPLSYLLNNV